MSRIRTPLRGLLWLLALAGPGVASAAVELAFHSRAMGSSFPHALIVLRGTIDATGESVDANYGFTVRHQIGPSVLWGPVEGIVARQSRAYVAGTRRHFSLTLSDDQYRQVMALVQQWRALPQPSYRLRHRNCVAFVAEIATTLGLAAVVDRSTVTRPAAFLDRVLADNGPRLAAARTGAAAPARAIASLRRN